MNIQKLVSDPVRMNTHIHKCYIYIYASNLGFLNFLCFCSTAFCFVNQFKPRHCESKKDFIWNLKNGSSGNVDIDDS